MDKPQRLIKSQGGFTLIEIVVVLIIIAGLVAVVAPNIMNRLSDSKKQITRAKIANLETALKLFKVDNGFYPETGQGLNALNEFPSTGREPKRWKGPYLEKSQTPIDAWLNEFVYVGPDQTNNGTYLIISVGEDAVANTDDDLSSNDVQ
jgi:general secretion pathway protein G